MRYVGNNTGHVWDSNGNYIQKTISTLINLTVHVTCTMYTVQATVINRIPELSYSRCSAALEVAIEMDIHAALHNCSNFNVHQDLSTHKDHQILKSIKGHQDVPTVGAHEDPQILKYPGTSQDVHTIGADIHVRSPDRKVYENSQ